MKNIKNIIPFIASLALANLARAAEKLTIEPAHALPDYTKLTAATGTTNRILITALAIGDFNEDGQLDFVVQTGDPSTGNLLPRGAQVFVQNTNGGFTKSLEYLLPTSGVTWDFVPGDFNEDGHLDLIMEDSDDDLIIMLGNGNGTFQEAAALGLFAAGYFAIADLNGDRHLDLVAGKWDGSVGVFTGAGNGTFTLKSTLDTIVNSSSPRNGETMIGDVNRDGRADVVVASAPDFVPAKGNLDVFLGNGDGTFQPVVETSNVAVRRGALGDFNGDGLLDFAGLRGSPEQLEIWLGQGDGHFTKGKAYSLGVYNFAYGVRAGDLNYDGIPDVVVSGEQSSTVYAGPLSIFLGKGDGTFQPRFAFTQANGGLIINAGPHLIDFDQDGLLDILSVCWTSTARPNVEAITISLGKDTKRDPELGFLLNVQNSTPNATGPVVLEASTNLVDWIPLATNSPAATWPVVDTSASMQQRYYRTRRP